VSAGPVIVKSEGVPEVLADGAIVKGEDVPVTVVFPLREIAPVPVEKVEVPVCEKFPEVVIAPDVIAPVPVERDAKVAAPAFVTCQVEEVPKISTPVPEFEIAKTAPDAFA